MSGENLHAGHRERLKSKYLEYGLDSFTDVEAIELLLFFAIPRRSTNELAHALLNRFKSIRGVMEADLNALQSIPGIGESAALLLKLVTSLNQRYALSFNSKNTQISSSDDAGAYLLPYFVYRKEECSVLLCMDTAGRVIACHRLAEGSPGSVDLSTRNLVDLVLRDKAARVILAHNHISGVALPSKADVEATKLVFTALKLIGVELEDHIIVSEGDFVSMRDSGFFREF